MTIGVTEEHRALEDAVRGWATRHVPASVARATLDADDEARRPTFWSDLVAQGLTGMHLAEEYGGAGATVVDLAVALEQLGRAVAPGPFLPSTIVSTVLQLVAPGTLAKELLPGFADGSLTAAVSLGAAGLTATPTGGGFQVSGTVRPVLGAGMAELFLLSAEVDGAPLWFVVDAGQVSVELVASFDPTRRLGAVTLDAVAVSSDRVLGDLDLQTVRDVAAALAAAEAAGVAAWCLDTATAYAKVREQFGRPIGQFQAVKHSCADMLVEVEEIRAVAWDACATIADPAQRRLASAVAGSVAFDAAVDVANRCVQILGGIGFTWEHDAHIYLKRAMALRSLLGGGSSWRTEVTELALSGARRTLALDLPEDEAGPFRAEIRAFLAGIEGADADTQRRALSDSGYAVPHWPAPYGRTAGAIEQLVIDEEFGAAGVRKPNLVIGGWVLPTIIQHGTNAQREDLVLPTLYGELTWCQMFSEPGAGSDLASIEAKATRVEGGWVLNGQKVWTSLAHKADWSLCIARTSPDKPKHEGITAFLIDMKSEGLDIRPLREITGMALFNEIFLNDVFVPDELVVGAVDDGWKMARATLANERVAMSSGSSMGSSVENVLALVAAAEQVDPLVADRVGGLVAEGQLLSLLGFRTTLRQLSGVDPGAGASVRKLVGTLHAQDCADLAIELLGPEGATTEGPAQEVAFTFLNTRCLTIAGGTTAVQKNVVAERLLGLPRDPEPGK